MDCHGLDQGWHTQFLTKFQKLDGFELLSPWRICPASGKWFCDDDMLASGQRLLSPFVQDTQHGRELRERVVQGDVGAAAGVVPSVVAPVLAAARARADCTHPRLRAVGAGHTDEEFIAAVRGAPSSAIAVPFGSPGLIYILQVLLFVL